MTMTVAHWYNIIVTDMGSSIKKYKLACGCLPQRKRGNMIAFLNAFISYLLLFVIMVAIAGVGIFIGITLRKRKDLKTVQVDSPEEK